MPGINWSTCPCLWYSVRIYGHQSQLCTVQTLQIWQKCFSKHNIDVNKTENNSLPPRRITKVRKENVAGKINRRIQQSWWHEEAFKTNNPKAVHSTRLPTLVSTFHSFMCRCRILFSQTISCSSMLHPYYTWSYRYHELCYEFLYSIDTNAWWQKISILFSW